MHMSTSSSESSGFASSGFESSDISSYLSDTEEERSGEYRSLHAPIKRRKISDSNDRRSAVTKEPITSRATNESSSHELPIAQNLHATGYHRNPSGVSSSIFIPLHDESRGPSVSEPNDDQREQSFFISRFTTGRDKEKESEARRMARFLTCCERDNLSQKNIKRLLQTDVVDCTETYDTLKAHIIARCGVKKRFALMCPAEHMARKAGEEDSHCETASCKQEVSKANRYWYRYVSEMVRALCREKSSFRYLMSGCEKAKRAVREEECQVLYDFYDGGLFKTKYKEMMEKWNQNTELHVFLTFSSDGFEEFSTRKGARSAWPLSFIVLNYPAKQRFKAGNALLAAFIPGSHDSKHFDSFLEPIVHDLKTAAKGINAVCSDGRTRMVFTHVIFATFDYPAASKCMGFTGHQGTFFCRRCHKTLTHIPEAGGRYAIPERMPRTRGKVSREREEAWFAKWLINETPELRSDNQTRKVWERIGKALSSSKRGDRSRIAKETGISRVPIIGILPLDFVESTPYDPMHLIFLGMIRLLLRLFFGKHRKTEGIDTFVMSEEKQTEINRALERAYVGIPSQWGRKPESLEFLSNYKAEDLKLFGLFLGPMVFSGPGIPTRVSKLWGHVSNIVHISCDLTPLRKDIEELKSLVQKFHILYTTIFWKEERFAFCFPPTTHAILHLPEMMKQCGPLTNVSQFIVERLVGEIGRLIGSTSRPEANLFHKTHFLFGLRLLNGGLCGYDSDEEDDAAAGAERLGTGDGKSTTSEETHSLPDFGMTSYPYEFLGKGFVVVSNNIKKEVYQYLRIKLGDAISDRHITKVTEYARCRMGASDNRFDIETESHFGERCRRNSVCRQKFWIAGVFENQDVGDGSEIRYYGRVKNLWFVQFQYRGRRDLEESQQTLGLAKIDWQYGITKDKNTGMCFVKTGRGERRGSLRHVITSIEDVHCIKQLIGFFDHTGRRYFMDMERHKLETSSEIKLGGKL